MLKLLIVDDEPIIREGLSRMLEWDRLNVALIDVCADASSALAVMAEEMPDILLTDVKMPGMSGLELAERGRNMYPHLQVIILSGYEEFDLARQALRAGVMAYLIKPCEAEELETVILQAAEKIGREKKLADQVSRERKQRVQQLIAMLEEWMQSPNPSRPIDFLSTALQDKTDGDATLLRDALVCLLTRSASEYISQNWRFAMVQTLYDENADMAEAFVQCMDKLRGKRWREKSFVAQMVEFVEEHYAMESLTLQYIADHVLFMNADYIGKEFQRCMHSRFSAYLLAVRMEKAKMLLRVNPPMHSYEIAERVGLGNNPHYFSHVFKKSVGMTTTEYRNQHQAKTSE